MPLDIHVYKGPKTPDSHPAFGQERYAPNPNATGSIGSGNFTNAQKDALERYQQSRILRYQDPDAYFCSACWYVFGVECPKCHAKSEPGHNRPTYIAHDDPLFEVDSFPEYDRKDGRIWVVTTCRKCSYSFRVIKR
jgi:hypothetical protein